MKNKLINIMNIIIALFSSACFTLKINKDFEFVYDVFLISLLTIIFSFIYFKYYKEKKFKIFSMLLACFMIIGESFNVVGSFEIIFHSFLTIILSLCRLIGFYFIFNLIINKIYLFFDKYKEKKNKNKIINFIFEKHPILMPFIILFICYLPYIIGFYPAILSPDPSNQIKQFFHIETSYLDYTILLDPNVYITGHHPVLHTVILGGLAKIGDMIGSVNIGLFIYSLLQISFLIYTLSYTINLMKKMKTPYLFRIITLIIYGFVPIFPFYGMSALKDVVFNCLVILFTIKVFEFIHFKPKYKIKDILCFSIIMLLMTMFRHNGIYVILFTMPIFVIVIKHERIKNIIMTMVVICLYLIYGKFLIMLNITPGSVREKYSIPFQQTARYVKYYADEIEESDIKIIDKVLNYKTLSKRYDPEKADPVKNKFNKYATNDDLNAYFKVWFKYLFKRPLVYIEATLNNTYGYFYPNARRWYIYTTYDSRLSESGIDYHFNKLDGLRVLLRTYGESFMYIPILGLLINIAINVWIFLMIGFFLIHKKKYKYLIYLLPNLSLILVCFASPVNTYFRYTLGFVFATPIMLSIYFHLTKEMGE